MEEVIIPAGKSLRYRCGVKGCQCNRHFSAISIWEHLASHFAKNYGNRHYNYRCQSCGQHFYNLGMADSCRCSQKTDGRFESVRLDLSSAAIRHDISFSSYYKRHVIPVLVNDDNASASRQAPMKSDLQREPSNTKTSRQPSKTPTERSRTPRSSEDAEDSRGMNWPMMRSPSMYADGTPRTPREDDEEEEAEPAYVRAMRSRCQSRAGSPTHMENTCDESAASNAPASTSGSQEQVSSSQTVENVSKRATFAWPPPEPTPELLILSSVATQPTTSYGHRQDSTPSASERISPQEPARSQDFNQSGANDGLAQIPQPNDHSGSKASDEGMILPPPPPPPSLSHSSHGSQTLQPEAAPSGTANTERDERRSRKASTVRVPGRRSRQDALLEENPSPPPVSRRRASRSPTPYRRSPSQSRPGTPANHPQTPATGYHAPAHDAQEHRATQAPPNQKVRKQNSSTNEDSSSPVERQRPSSRSANGSCEMQRAGSSTSATRTPHKRSRQDALLEENPSPPTVSRRVSSSPGPFSRAGSRTPIPTPASSTPRYNRGSPQYGLESQESQDEHQTQTHGNRSPYHNFGGRTPAYGTSQYSFKAWPPVQGGQTPYQNSGSRTPAHGSQIPCHNSGNGASTQGGQTPYYNSGGRTPVQGGQTPYHNSGSRTPAHGSQNPFYNSGRRTPADGGQAPYHNFGGRTPVQEGQTPYYNSGGRTPAHGSQNPCYNSGRRTPAEGGQTPCYNSGGRTPVQEGQTPHYNSGGLTPAHGNQNPCYNSGRRTPAEGGQTPYYNSGGRTPVQEGQTPHYNSGRRTPAEGGQTPYYNSGGRTPVQGGQTPYYNYGGPTPAQGCRTPNYDSGSSIPVHGNKTPYRNAGSPSSNQRSGTPHNDFADLRSGACTPRNGSCTPEPYAPSSSQHAQLDNGHEESRNRRPNATSAIQFNRGNDHSGRGGYTPMRSPSQYEDGTCRTPRQDDDEEEDLPAYLRGRKEPENDAKRPFSRTGDKSGDYSLDRPSSRSCSDQENIAPSANHGPATNIFEFPPTPQYPPPMFGPPVPNSLPPWPFPPFPAMYPMNGWMPNPVSGIPSFGPPLVPPPPQPPQLSGSFPPPPSGTIPPPPPPPPPPPLPNEHSPSNRATKAGKSSGIESTRSNTAPAAPKPPERVGGSKFLESVPPVPKANTSTTAKRPYQRKRRLSRANGDDSD